MRLTLCILCSFCMLSVACATKAAPPPPLIEKSETDYGVEYGLKIWSMNAHYKAKSERQHKITDGASNMLWIEHIIAQGKAQGVIRTESGANWVRQFYAAYLIKNQESFNGADVKDYIESNPVPIDDIDVSRHKNLSNPSILKKIYWREPWIHQPYRGLFAFDHFKPTSDGRGFSIHLVHTDPISYWGIQVGYSGHVAHLRKRVSAGQCDCTVSGRLASSRIWFCA